MMKFLPLLLSLPTWAAAIDPTQTKDFEIFGVKINSDSYSVVVDQLGDTKLVRPKSTGAGPNGPATFCYRGKDGTRLTFIQGFSEDYTHVTGYRLEASPTKANRNCKSLARLNSSLRTGNGLGLGLSREEVEKILGKPTSGDSTSAKFDFDKKVTFGGENSTKGNIYSLGVDAAYTKQGKVRALEVNFMAEGI